MISVRLANQVQLSDKKQHVGRREDGMELGQLGVWYFFDGLSSPAAAEAAKRIESLGYGTLWLPETVGKSPVATASWVLSQTE